MNQNGNNYSQLGKEVSLGTDEYGQISSDYVPPPPSLYGSGEEEAGIDNGLDLDGTRSRRKKATILAIVSGVFALIIAGAGSFFWFTGLQSINNPDRNLTENQRKFNVAVRDYEAGKYLEVTTALPALLTDKDVKVNAAAYLFAVYATLGQQEETSLLPENALTDYKQAVDYATTNKLQAGVKPTRIPSIPQPYTTLDGWVKGVTDRRDMAQLYIDGKNAQSAALRTENPQEKEQKLIEASDKLSKLVQKDPSFLAKMNMESPAVKLTETYRDMAGIKCNSSSANKAEATNYFDQADKVMSIPAIQELMTYFNRIKGGLETTKKDCK